MTLAVPPREVEGIPVTEECGDRCYLPGDDWTSCELRVGHREEWHEATWHMSVPDDGPALHEVVMRWRRQP